MAQKKSILSQALPVASAVKKAAINVGKAIIAPAVRYGQFVGGGLIQAPVLAASRGRVNIPFLNNQELQRFSGNTLGQRLANTAPEGARRTMGAMAYALPMGMGGPAAGPVMRFGTGALAGGMFAGSDKPQGMSNQQYARNIGTGAVIGGAANVVIPAVAQQIARKMQARPVLYDNPLKPPLVRDPTMPSINLERMQDMGRGLQRGGAFAQDTQKAMQLHPELGQVGTKVNSAQGAIQEITKKASRYVSPAEMQAYTLLKSGMSPNQVMQKTGIGAVQAVSQRSRGLGLLADFDNAMRAGDTEFAKQIASTIIRQPGSSAYAQYRTSMVDFIQRFAQQPAARQVAQGTTVLPGVNAEPSTVAIIKNLMNAGRMDEALQQAQALPPNSPYREGILSTIQNAPLTRQPMPNAGGLGNKPPEIQAIEMELNNGSLGRALHLINNLPPALQSLGAQYRAMVGQAFR